MTKHTLHHRTHTILALCISLTLILTPLAAQASPTATVLPQTTVYEDPDGLFTLAVPEGFTEQAAITYETLGDNPLDKLVNSSGLVFTEADSPNGISVLFLLLDESITDRDEFAGFLAAFQTAAGGETLPLVDLEFVDGESLRAAGNAATRDRHLQIEIEVQDNVAAIVSTSVERSRYRELRNDLADALDSFTWQPSAVLAALGAEGPPATEEPTGDEPEVVEPEETTEETTDAPPPANNQLTIDEGESALETERVSDLEQVFSLALPVGLESEELSDDNEAIYGYGYFGPDDEDFPSIAIAFTPAAYAAQGATGDIDFRELEDEEWDEFVDTFIVDDLDEMNVFTDIRDEILRTAFLVFDAEEADADSPSEVWVWAEESNGVAAVIAIFGELDDPANADIFHEAVTTFTWSPDRATATIADVVDMPDPAQMPVAFDDPFDLIEASVPAAYPFQSAYFEEDSVEYTFGRNAIDGLFQISLSVPSESAFNSSSWSLIVDETEASVMQTMSNGSLGDNAQLIDTEIGEPDVDADNSAVILARTDLYWMAVVLIDRDGVLTSEVIILPDSYWQEYEDVVVEAASLGVNYDPDAIRDAMDASQELGTERARNRHCR